MGFRSDEVLDWSPKTFLDLRFPWPERYIRDFGQPYNSYTFARNSAAVVGLKDRGFDPAMVERIAAYLDFVAQQYTRREGDCAFIINEFDYGYLWSKFQRGFRGAFMNNVTAYGYMHLFAATDEKKYLDQARQLIWSSARCETQEVKLHSVDENGQLWLNEYVFHLPAEDEQLFAHLGFRKGDDGWWRARVFNGHIYALLAYYKYRAITEDDQFDDIIKKATGAMEHYLPSQTYQNGYFSYMVEFPMWPDYGQARAVHLAEGLCRLAPSDALCSTAKDMRSVFDGGLAQNDTEIRRAASAKSKSYVTGWRNRSR